MPDISALAWDTLARYRLIEILVLWEDRVVASQIGETFSEVGLFGNQNTVCKPTTPKWSHTVERLKQVWRIDDE